MESWSRKDTVSLMLNLEKLITPAAADVQGINVWPWVRVQLFFYIIGKYERLRLEQGVGPEKKGLKPRINGIIKSIRSWKKLYFMKADLIFVGAKSHRGSLEGCSYNKFFDPIRKQLEPRKTILIEYSANTTNAFMEKDNLSITALLPLFRFLNRKKIGDPAMFRQLQLIVQRYFDAHNLPTINLSFFFEQHLVNRWKQVQLYEDLWRLIFKLIKPAKIFTLCYYNNYVYALNKAVQGENITTYEMQHGPINSWHLAYGSFDNIPFMNNSPFLPKAFLVWDQPSYQVLARSFPNLKVYEVGLPWLDFIESLDTTTKKNKRVILYAMQPAAEIGSPFPPFLKKWISESAGEYEWWLRLHPRQSDEYTSIKEEAEKIFKPGGFEIEKASNTPLPIVLRNSDIVITSFSGVVTEAAFMGIPSIAFHPNAFHYFSSEFDAKATYLVKEEELSLSWNSVYSKFRDYVNFSRIERKNSLEEFKKIV